MAENLLANTAVKKLVFRMAIPATMAIAAYQIYTVVDTLYISRIYGLKAMGGLAASLPVMIVLSALGSSMRSGASTCLSLALGNNQYNKASKIVGNTCITFWSIAILISIIGLTFLNPILLSIGVTESLLPYAADYCRIILIGAITSTGFSGLIRAEGNSRYAMFQWIIPLGVNIIIDPILILSMNLGIQGAAIGTVISQMLSVYMFVNYYFISNKSKLIVRITDFLPEWNIVREIVKTGLPTFINIISQAIMIIVINNVLKHYNGEIYIGLYGIASKIIAFSIIPVFGLIQGIQPIMGYNYGAREYYRVMETMSKAMVYVISYGLLVNIAVIVFGKQLIAIFINDITGITIGSQMIRVISLGIVFNSLNMIITVFLIVIGRIKTTIMLTLCQYTLCFIPILLFLAMNYGVQYMWWAFPISSFLILSIGLCCKKRYGGNLFGPQSVY